MSPQTNCFNSRAILAILWICLGVVSCDNERNYPNISFRTYLVTDSSYVPVRDYPEFVSGKADEGENFLIGIGRNAIRLQTAALVNRLEPRMKEESGQARPDWGFNRYRIEYYSVDGSGYPLTLSEMVVVPVGIGWQHRPGGIFLESHIAVTDNSQCPTENPDWLECVSAKDMIFICPDLQGLGASKDRTQTIFAHSLQARQSIDGLMAALEFLEYRHIAMQDGWGLLNGGYSQGGSVALAIHRYIENNLSPSEQERVNLKESACGGGFYDPAASFMHYYESETVERPYVIPLAIMGIMEGFPDLFKGINTEDIYSEKMIASGLLRAIAEKNTNLDPLNKEFLEKVGNKVTDILSEEFLDPDGDMIRRFMDALEGEDMTTGWLPERKVTIYHGAFDRTAPYINAEHAYDGLHEGNFELVRIPDSEQIGQSHLIGGMLFFIKMLLGNED